MIEEPAAKSEKVSIDLILRPMFSSSSRGPSGSSTVPDQTALFLRNQGVPPAFIRSGGIASLRRRGAEGSVRTGPRMEVVTISTRTTVIPNGTYYFRAIEGGQLVVEYATVCFRSFEDFGPG